MLVAVLSVFFIFSLYLIITRTLFQRCRKATATKWLNKLIKNEKRNSSVQFSDTPLGNPFVSEKDTRVRNTLRALLVTAHPDDECMFFAPTILMLLELNVSVRLLCLSSGDYYNQGGQRRKELLGSCDVLGIPAAQVVIVDMKELPDDPSAEWSIALISSLILKQVKDSAINLVLTFDERGVSGHANHIAIFKALRYLSSTGSIPNSCCLVSLQSVSIFRKYLSVLDLPITWLCATDLCSVAGLKEYRRAKRAMLCHRSQMLWFRHLYVLASRFMFINTFQVIANEKKDLKIY